MALLTCACFWQALDYLLQMSVNSFERALCLQHAQVKSASLWQALERVPGLVSQAGIPSSRMAAMRLDPQDERRLGFRLRSGWAGELLFSLSSASCSGGEMTSWQAVLRDPSGARHRPVCSVLSTVGGQLSSWQHIPDAHLVR